MTQPLIRDAVPAGLDPDQDLFAQGLNYAGILELVEQIQRELGVAIDLDALLEQPTLRRLRALVGEPALATVGAGAAPAAERPGDPELRALLAEAEIRTPVELDRDLFEQGVTSLSVLRVLSRARARSGAAISLEDFLSRPTMRHLAELCVARPAAAAVPAAAPPSLPPVAARALGALGSVRGEADKHAFLQARHDLRRIDPGAPRVAGPAQEPGAAEPANEAYAARRSRRTFARGPVPLDPLLGWLGCLDEIDRDGAPRRRYPSAGSTYAVQVYLEVKPGGVAGLDPGLYYYHPRERALVRLSTAQLATTTHYAYNQPIHERAAMCLHFVAERAAIEPVYGAQTDRFVAVEVGCMIQLLMEHQVRYQIGGCVLAGMEDAELRQALGLAASHQVLLAMACGGLDVAAADLAPTPRAAVPGPAVRGGDVAIVAMRGRFPGAASLEQYWDNLMAGRVSLSAVPADRWPARPGQGERSAGFLDAIYDFDPAFFGVSPAEAAAMDPQERLVLQSVYELIELAGYCGPNLARLGRDVGVFVGVMWNDARTVADEACARGDRLGHAPLSSIANRISHFFDWTGPSLAVDASCASALTALCLACDAIRQGSCRAAVVGGVNLFTHPSHADNLARLGLLSRGAEIDAFGDGASGWLAGEGVGALLLRPLADATADRDHVWGVIRAGTMMSGGRVPRYGAPSTERQRELMQRTLEAAGVAAADVQYVEAAAAGSAIGDASEMLAIQRVFAPRAEPLWVGSVKPNIGHLESASGLSQIIKVLLQFEHATIAPMVRPRAANPLNPLIRLDGGPIAIVERATPWQTAAGSPRRALVNGFGGTGAYASVLVEAPPAGGRIAGRLAGGPTVFALSAETTAQLGELARTWLAVLVRGDLARRGIGLGEIAATLMFGRDRFPARLAIVAVTPGDVIEGLEAFAAGASRDRLVTGTAGAAARASAPATLVEAARAWVTGGWDDWSRLVPGDQLPKVPLPTYPFRRVRCARVTAEPAPVAPAPATVAPPPATATRLEAVIRDSLATQLGELALTMEAGQRILDLGLTSMGMARVIRELETRLATELPIELLLRCHSVADLVADLAETAAAGAAVAAPVIAGGAAPVAAAIAAPVAASVRSAAAAAPPRPRPAQTGELPLSEGQAGLWTIQRLDPDTTAYNCPVCFHIDGPLDRELVAEACAALVRRYPILSAAIREVDGAPVQRFDTARPIPIAEDGLGVASGEDLLAQIRARVRSPFRLADGPMLRVHLLRRAAGDSYLLLTIHHIVFDGGSFRPLSETFWQCYRELAAGRSPELLPDPAAERSSELSFAGFVAAERDLVGGPEGVRRAAYWKAELAGELPSLGLHREGGRAAGQRPRRGACTHAITPALSAQIRELARAQTAYVSTVFLAVFQALVYRYTAQRDAIVGIPVDLRTGEGSAAQIGCFVNMVPIRSAAAPDLTFSAFLAQIQARSLRGLANSYPFARLVRELGIAAAGRTPIFQAVFAYQGEIGRAATDRAAGLAIAPVEEIFQDGEYELALDVYERDGGFVLRLGYDADAYDAAVMAQLVEQYVRLLDQVVRDPARRLGQYALLSERDLAALADWNATGIAYAGEQRLHRLFEAQAARQPDALAVQLDGDQLSYGELDRRSNQLARYLRRHGVGPDTLVGVCMDRSLELMIGLLAILKAGGAYVPIDPEHPARRIDFVVGEIRAPVLLVQHDYQDKLADRQAVRLCVRSQWDLVGRESDAAIESGVEPHHLAYVIYTSGSTGAPKGCMLAHAAVHNRLRWMQDRYRLTERDRVLQKTPYSFDVSVWELFWPLLYGAPVIFAAPGRHTDPRYLVQLIEARGITICHFVPSMLRAFVQVVAPGQCGSLTKIFASGEALPYPLFEDVHAALGAELHNLYGPTEAAVDVTFWHAQPRADRRIPIGRPIANVQIHILDPGLERTPIGVPGELYIGGAGLARGYLGRPELTQERFIANPYDEGQSPRLYKTGDRARWLPEGTIEYLGRLDHQVKVRGFRIELGEIEACLLGHDRIASCVVTVEDDGRGDHHLVAYVVTRDGEPPSVAELRGFVAEALPAHMIPSSFVALTALPLTPSGKLDRGAIASLTQVIERDRVYVAPRSELERALQRMWIELLGVEPIGVHDPFFELGGHSLKVALLVSRIERELGGAVIDQVAFYRTPTIEGLAAQLAPGGQRAHDLLPQLLEAKGSPELSVICCPYAGAQPIIYQPLAAELARRSDRISVYAVAPPAVGAEAGLDSVEAIAAACVERILATVTGPVAVYGHCTGTFTALEIVRQLELRGRGVTALFVAAALPFHWAARLLPVSDLWQVVSDTRIHRMMKAWGAPKDEIDPATLHQMVGRFRRDARQAFGYGKAAARGTLATPLINIVSADDPLTKGHRDRYRRWQRHAEQVRLIVLGEGEHYFVGKLAGVVADIVVRIHRDRDAMIRQPNHVIDWQ